MIGSIVHSFILMYLFYKDILWNTNSKKHKYIYMYITWDFEMSISLSDDINIVEQVFYYSRFESSILAYGNQIMFLPRSLRLRLGVETDEVALVHINLALDEIDKIVRDMFSPNLTQEKKIFVLNWVDIDDSYILLLFYN